MFKPDLEVIDALRTEAIQVAEPHPSGIKKLAAYAGQLAWMSAKFPIDVGVLSLMTLLCLLIPSPFYPHPFLPMLRAQG